MRQAKIYFLKQSNSVEADGPFTLEDLQRKELNHDTPIYTNSTGEWKKASSYVELLPIIDLQEASKSCAEESSTEEIESFPESDKGSGEEFVNEKLKGTAKVEPAESTISRDVQESSNLSFWQAYMRCWKKYGDFSGRARRLEYWSWTLVNLIVLMLFVAFLSSSDFSDSLGFWTVGFLLYFLATIVPSFSSQVRRFHDSGLSGWNILWSAFPYIGGIIILVLTLRDSEKGQNKWGPNPKGQ